MSKLEELIQELCPDGVEYKKIGEICDISRGRVISKDYIRDNNGDYPVYSSQTEFEGILGRINTFDYDGEYITWTTDGANAGSVFYRFGKFSVTNVCGLLKLIDSNIITKYIFYTLTITTPKYVNKGMGNPKLMSNVMANIKVPVPPLEVQKEIVRILDNFTELTTELTTELDLRKKQYEYYRDKLLSYDIDIKTISLNKLFNTKNGYTPSKSNPEYWTNGTIPWFRMEDIRENGSILNDSIQHISESAIKGKAFPPNSIIVSTSATIGQHALITCESLANQRFTYLMLKEEYKSLFNIKFLYYYCFKLDEYCANCLNQSNFASVDMSKFNKFEFPILPLDVQERIVNVLDNFEKICSDLQIGLPAEIDARQKQYEYYRDLLLNFDKYSCSQFVKVERERERERESLREYNSQIPNKANIIKMLQYVFGYVRLNLEDIAILCRGKRVVKSQLSESGNYAVYQNSMTPLGYYDDSNCSGGTTFVIAAGAAGEIGYSNTDFWAADDCYYFDCSELLNSKFLYYSLKSKQEKISSQVRKASVPRLSRLVLEKLEVCLPPLKEQNRIVAILDRFDSLCNDITKGLPAEIDARQKQYEYYRDKLLNFKELKK